MRLFLAGAVTFALAGCSSGNNAAVRELMKAPIAPASDAIFNAVAYTNGQLAAAPQNDAEWQRLRGHAQSLTRSADTLATLAPVDERAEWLKQSAAMKAASREVERAVDGKDLEQILTGGGNLYATCTNCHATYIKDE